MALAIFTVDSLFLPCLLWRGTVKAEEEDCDRLRGIQQIKRIWSDLSPKSTLPCSHLSHTCTQKGWEERSGEGKEGGEDRDCWDLLSNSFCLVLLGMCTRCPHPIDRSKRCSTHSVLFALSDLLFSPWLYLLPLCVDSVHQWMRAAFCPHSS